MTDALKDRGKGLEDAFFAKQDALLRQRLAQRRDAASRRAALAEASGLKDEALLDKLLALDVTPALLTAISLAPPVLVAWADGRLQPEERSALLGAAERAGLRRGTAGHAVFENWLASKPPENLFDIWSAATSALMSNMDSTLR